MTKSTHATIWSLNNNSTITSYFVIDNAPAIQELWERHNKGEEKEKFHTMLMLHNLPQGSESDVSIFVGIDPDLKTLLLYNDEVPNYIRELVKSVFTTEKGSIIKFTLPRQTVDSIENKENKEENSVFYTEENLFAPATKTDAVEAEIKITNKSSNLDGEVTIGGEFKLTASDLSLNEEVNILGKFQFTATDSYNDTIYE